MKMDGKKLSEEILYSVSDKIRKRKLDISLAIIMIGNNDASKVYVRNKKLSCEKVGIKAIIHEYESISQETLIKLIEKLNADGTVHGIILQSPVPGEIDFSTVVSHIHPLKDVDGLSATNIYKNYMNYDCILPCTVSGILKLLSYYDIILEGKNVCIIGRSNLVGKPLSIAMQNKGATVSLCHSKTTFLGDYTEVADIIVVACGVPNLLKDFMVKPNVVVIDVGINRVNGKLCGDTDYEHLFNKCSHITPVPGGVGPMTVACVIENTLICYERLSEENGQRN